MANTFTPNLSLTLMEVGANRDTWGSTTNGNMTTLDGNIGTKSSQITALQNTDATHTSQISTHTNQIATLQNQIATLQNQTTDLYNWINNAEKGYLAWVPVGTVLLWPYSSGIPAKFAICDGRTVARTDGGGNITTPNLVDRFVRGSTSPQLVGGSWTTTPTTSAAGSHSHAGVTGDTALSIAQMPAHTHTVPNSVVGSGGSHFQLGPPGGDQLVANQVTTSTGSGAAHNHLVFADGSHQHTVTVDLYPPWMTMIYIMRV